VLSCYVGASIARLVQIVYVLWFSEGKQRIIACGNFAQKGVKYWNLIHKKLKNELDKI
jgi:hypothetical protein